MARNFPGAIARVWRICSELSIKNRKHAMLWIFQVFALSASLYGYQLWATKTLTFKSSATIKAHIHHISFLKMLLGVKQSTNTWAARESPATELHPLVWAAVCLAALTVMLLVSKQLRRCSDLGQATGSGPSPCPHVRGLEGLCGLPRPTEFCG